MIVHFNLPTLAVVAGVLSAWAAAPVSALVDLEWRPGSQAADVGEIVEVGFYAVSDDDTDRAVSAIEVILLWDPTFLELVGFIDDGPYQWSGSDFSCDNGSAQDCLNCPCDVLPDDGNAYYVASAQLGAPAYATPEGLLITTFRFRVLSNGVTELTLAAEFGDHTLTQVWDGVTPNWTITGSLGAPAEIRIGIPPVPAIGGWGAFATALLMLTSGTIITRSRRRL